MTEKITKIMDSGHAVDHIFLNVPKAFDSVNHHFLIQKAYGTNDNIVNRIVVPTRMNIHCFNQWKYVPPRICALSYPFLDLRK